MSRASPTKTICVLAYPGADLVDITGPFEVFATASAIETRKGRSAPYRVRLMSADGGPLKTDSGLELVADRSIADGAGGIDTLLVVGGAGKFDALEDGRLVPFLAAAAPKVRRIGSVCTGAFLLAEAALLAGRRAVTHWEWCDEFQRRYPEVRLESDAIFIEDAGVFTTAGVTAGIDLALSLVEADCGRALALEVARSMVVFVKRPGGQAQFSAQLSVQWSDRRPIRAVQDYIAANPDRPLAVEDLAKRAGMSPRNFARVFRDETGMTPGRFVDSIRLERARTLLEEGKLSVDRVAAASGYASAEVMRRSFHRFLGVSPKDYAGRFNPDVARPPVI